jgi:hypothetical protein
MRHWADELSKRVENRASQESGQLGRLASTRVRDCILEALEIYNKRREAFGYLQHTPAKMAGIDPPQIENDGNLMMITLSKDGLNVVFEFIATHPSVTIQAISKEARIERSQREISIDDNGRLNLVFNGQRKLLEDVVQEVLQPILFPDLPPAWKEYHPVY